jgi:hypothetical protein
MFGVKLASDAFEKICEMRLRPPLIGARRLSVAQVYAAGALFIHIPKNAGMSISQELYGLQIKHASIRYYARVVPDLVKKLPSFAILRDPVERFLSAYHYGLAGGSRDNAVSLPYRSTYMGFGSIDDALDHLEGTTTPFGLDHIFRPQCWYICDADGRIAVNNLAFLEQIARLDNILPGIRFDQLPWLNGQAGKKDEMSGSQTNRLRRIYPQDFLLVDWLRASGGYATFLPGKTGNGTKSLFAELNNFDCGLLAS